MAHRKTLTVTVVGLSEEGVDEVVDALTEALDQNYWTPSVVIAVTLDADEEATEEDFAAAKENSWPNEEDD